MKVSLKELRRAIKMMVQETIREEVKKVLPGLVAEALAERYLKKVMAEVVRPVSKKNPSNLRELMQGDNEEDWEEEVPEALENDHQGIYHQSPLVRGKGGSKNESVRREMLAKVYGEDPESALRDPREQREEAVSRIAQGNSELAAMFEGTRPVVPEAMAGGAAMGETQQQFGEEGVPLDFLGKIGVNFGNIKRNLEGNVPAAAKERVDEDQARRLAQKWGKPTG